MLKGDDVLSRIEYLRKDIPRETTPNEKLGVINVGEMREYVKSKSEDKRNLTVTHEPKVDPEHPELDCEYHCGVRGFRYGEDLMADLIAECVKGEYPTSRKSRDSRMPR